MSSNKVLWAVGLGLVGIGVWKYLSGHEEPAADKKTDDNRQVQKISNPWEGSKNKCEAAFNKLSEKDQKDLAEFIETSARAGQGNDPQVVKTVQTFLGLDKMDCALPIYVDVRV